MTPNQEPTRGESIHPQVLEWINRVSKLVIQDPDSRPLYIRELEGIQLGRKLYQETGKTDKTGYEYIRCLRLFDEPITRETGIAIELQTTLLSPGSNTYEHKTTSIKLDGEIIEIKGVTFGADAYLFFSPINQPSTWSKIIDRHPFSVADEFEFNAQLGFIEEFKQLH